MQTLEEEERNLKRKISYTLFENVACKTLCTLTIDHSFVFPEFFITSFL